MPIGEKFNWFPPQQQTYKLSNRLTHSLIPTWRFVVSHRPYEGLKLRAGFHTGDVIAGVQVCLNLLLQFCGLYPWCTGSGYFSGIMNHNNILYPKSYSLLCASCDLKGFIFSVLGSRCPATGSLEKRQSLLLFSTRLEKVSCSSFSVSKQIWEVGVLLLLKV